MIELGAYYTDKITGFLGVAIGHVEYLTGCSQTLLQPACEEGARTKRPDAEWFDDQRMVAIPHSTRIVLDNGTTPGCDREAPKR
jgi:hypothetical protein